MKKFEWIETSKGYITCDLGFIQWEIRLASCKIWLNQLKLWHTHDTVEGAKIMVENRMREFINGLAEVSDEN